MRTDSFRVSDKAKKAAKDFVQERFGDDYLAEREYKYKEKKGAQFAHEAIRPTAVERTPDVVREVLSSDGAKLYDLIWKRFVAGFMAEAVFEQTKVTIASGHSEFSCDGKQLVFEGFFKVLPKDSDNPLIPVKEKEELILKDIRITEHKTQPPPRFSDASLIRIMEEKGIGRPSTYAPTISTLIYRNYARREKNHLIPTELGVKVCEILVENFPQIMDENFTALMEEKLDKVEEEGANWKEILEEFYPAFKERVDKATLVLKKTLELIDRNCPKCKRPLAIKWSRKGKFLSCSGYPACKYAESITTGIQCPECAKGLLIERRNRKGQRFFGCTAYPACRYTTQQLPK